MGETPAALSQSKKNAGWFLIWKMVHEEIRVMERYVDSKSRDDTRYTGISKEKHGDLIVSFNLGKNM